MKSLPAPMLLSERRGFRPFDQPGWAFEIKYDGYRLLAGADHGKVQLATKSGVDATRWFPELVHALGTLPGGPHVLDGEVVVLDDLGRSDFDRLRARASRRRWVEGCDPVAYCAFDLLARDGRSLIALPLEIRKAQLRELRGLLDFSAKSDGSTDERWRGFWRFVTRKCLSDNGFLLVLQSGCSPHQCWVDFSRWCLFSPQFATAGSAPRSAPVGSGRRRAG